MTGALGVALQKPAAYRRGDGPMPEPAEIERSIVLVGRAARVAPIGMTPLKVVLEKAVMPVSWP